MKKYKCSLDRTAGYIVPGIMLLILLTMLVKPLYLSVTMAEDKRVALIYFAPALIIGISVAMYLYRTLSITVDDYSITINRNANPVTIAFSDILNIKQVADMKYSARTFGNGGLFGYTGKYYKKGIGSMTWYCTQRKNYILIEKANGKKIVVTPDDPDGFMQQIGEYHSSLIIPEQPTS